MEMPKIYVNPPRSEWPALTARCTRQEEEIGERNRFGQSNASQ